MTIVLTGGGSGGHVTPILAIAAELKQLQPEVKLIYIGQAGDQFAEVVAKDSHIDQVYYIKAGKFRRFYGEGLKQYLDLLTFYKNARDFFRVLIGTIQSERLIKRIKPDIVFSRGGYVSVPVAFGASLNQVPYITHDSDPIPSLANRIIARWAVMHAVALPKETYPYPPDKTITTGIPVSKQFVPINSNLNGQYRKEIDIPTQAKLLFIIGGGLGSQLVNDAVSSVVPHLINEFKDLYVVHVAGSAHEDAVKNSYRRNIDQTEQGRVRTFGYIDDVYRYSGAADLVITRAGATNLAEFAIQGKTCIVVPSSFLTGGHQLKSAEYLDKLEAAVVIDENELSDDPNRLAKQASSLLRDPTKRQTIATNLSALAKPNATNEIAKLILKLGSKREVDKIKN